jgi:integrase
MSERKRSSQLHGIEVRHEKDCPNFKIKDRTTCSKCTLKFRVNLWDKAHAKPLRGSWCANLPQVRREALDAQNKIALGQTTDAPAVTFREYAETWLEGVENGEVRNNRGKPYKPAVVRQYRSSLTKHVLPALGALKVDQVKRRHIQELADRLSIEYAGGSVRAHMSPIRAIFTHAIQREVVHVNPTDKLSLPAADKRKVVQEATGEKREMVIRSAADVLALIDRLPERDRPVFATAALAGLRRGELRALRVRHIDFSANVIRVRLNRDASAGDVDLKSDAGRRDVPIIERLRPYLVDQVARLGLNARPDDFVFPNRRGTALDADRYLERCRKYWAGTEYDQKAQEWVKVAESLDPLGLHDARHTCASLLIASKANLKQISRMLGHSSIKVTLDVYGHLLPGSEAEAAAAMNAYLDAELAA